MADKPKDASHEGGGEEKPAAAPVEHPRTLGPRNRGYSNRMLRPNGRIGGGYDTKKE